MDLIGYLLLAIPATITALTPILLFYLNRQVKAVHTLVNAEKTAAIERELAGLKREWALMKRLTPEETDAIGEIEVRIRALESDVAERNRQTAIAEKQTGLFSSLKVLT